MARPHPTHRPSLAPCGRGTAFLRSAEKQGEGLRAVPQGKSLQWSDLRREGHESCARMARSHPCFNAQTKAPSSALRAPSPARGEGRLRRIWPPPAHTHPHRHCRARPGNDDGGKQLSSPHPPAPTLSPCRRGAAFLRSAEKQGEGTAAPAHASMPKQRPPHPPLRGTFSHEGRREARWGIATSCPHPSAPSLPGSSRQSILPLAPNAPWTTGTSPVVTMGKAWRL